MREGSKQCRVGDYVVAATDRHPSTETMILHIVESDIDMWRGCRHPKREMRGRITSEEENAEDYGSAWCHGGSNPSREKVYKFEMVTPQLEAKQRFDGTYDVPVVEGEISVEEDRPWVDHPEESALDLVLGRNHIFVQGLAGTRKSWLVKRLVKTLRERGERAQCCAFTHVAAKNIGGRTSAHKYIFHGSFRAG